MAETLHDLRAEIEKLEARHAANPHARFFVPLANAYRNSGELEHAESLLREGLRQHPDYLSAHIVLGRCLEDRGAVEEAANEYRYVLSIDPQNLIALRRLGELAAATGRVGEAVQWYDQLLSLDPSNEDARRALDSLPSSSPAEKREFGDGGELDVAGVDTAIRSPAPFSSEEPEAEQESGAPQTEVPPGDEVVTETIAELYARQGLHDRAAAVYRELIRRRGGDPALEARLADLESQTVEFVPTGDSAEGAGSEGRDQETELDARADSAQDEDSPKDFDPFDDSFDTGFPEPTGAEEPLTIAGYLKQLVSWELGSGAPGMESADSALEPEPTEAAEAAYSEEPRHMAEEPDQDVGYAGSDVTFPWESSDEEWSGAIAADSGLEVQDRNEPTPEGRSEADLEVRAEREAGPAPGHEAAFELPAESGFRRADEPEVAAEEPSGRTDQVDSLAGGPEPEEPAPAASEEEEDDLESFQAWLRSLKR